jgi:hypothetical protein
MKLVGSYYVLATLPVWATAAILFAITMATILVGRDVLEGLPYNVAYSAIIGDAGLLIGVLIAATILQWGIVDVPQWLHSGTTHVLILFVLALGGTAVCLLTLGSRSGQAMDIYHDTVIAPLILYLAITLVPVIYYNGTKTEKLSVLVCFVLWASLVVFDIKYKRMDQRSWLQNHGVTFTIKK